MPRSKVFANLLFLLSFCLPISSAFGMESDQAWAAIESADSAIASAYQAVSEVEETGANVSGLLKDLNFGAEALAKANMLYRTGDFDEAVYFAELCYDVVVEVTAQANELKDLAVAERNQRFLINSLASTFGVGFAILGGILGWRLFKRRYYRRVLKMKPDLNRKNVLEKCS